MSRRTTRRALSMGALMLTLLGVAGAAVAVWTATGTGTGSGETGTNNITVTPGTSTAQLFPNGQADVELSISNPNPVTVPIASLELDTSMGTGGFAVDADHSGCAVTVLEFTTQTNGGSGWTVPARVGGVNGVLAITLTDALAMADNAANACQGATFTVYLKPGA